MTLSPGEPWGQPGPVPSGAVRAASDTEARLVLEQARHDGRPYPPLLLTGGDLWRTLGGAGGDGTAVFPVDLGEALIDGRLRLFVAHLVARNRVWSRVFVAMNAQWRGRWNLGPRAHPGDGLLDTYDARLGLADLVKVHRRLHHGTHLPHPGVRERRAPAVQIDLERPTPVELDGVGVGTGRVLSVRVEPAALTVAV